MHLGMSAERAARLHKPNKARVVGGLLNEFGNMPWAHVDDPFPFFFLKKSTAGNRMRNRRDVFSSQITKLGIAKHDLLGCDLLNSPHPTEPPNAK
jgi:hypothetical protein